MNNISGFGLIVTVLASNTFPLGYPLTQFADDSDPFAVDSLQVADSAMGLNGDLVTWSKATPIKINISILANTPDDLFLSTLLNANRVGRGKIGARDTIQMTALYPAGNFVVLSNGVITDGPPLSSVSSEGRLTSKTYSFVFENRVGA